MKNSAVGGVFHFRGVFMKKSFVLVDERISEKCLYSLLAEGFNPIKLPGVPNLPSAIASHTDIITFKLENKIFLSKAYFNTFFDILPPLEAENLCLTECSQGVNYPLDAIFNGLLMGDKLFCKRDSFSKEIIASAEKLGIKIISVKQGYPACTVLKISENAAITADKGMAKALRSEGISVLEIESGDVLLPPYEYGFIGGAGELHEDKVYFFGDIHTHKDHKKIIDFIEENKKTVHSLSDESLRDLGGMLFV